MGDCEWMIWRAMVGAQLTDSWQRKSFGPSTTAVLFVNFLCNLVRFVDHQDRHFCRFNFESSTIDLRELIRASLESTFEDARNSILPYLPDNLQAIKTDDELFKGFAEWSRLALETVGGVHGSFTSWDSVNRMRGRISRGIRVPSQFPDHTVLGLVTEFPRAARAYEIVMSELDAGFICTGPFRVSLTTILDERLTFDSVKERILVFWDRKVLPGETALIFKGNRVARFGISIIYR